MAPSASPNAMNWNKMINPITSHDAFAILPENKTTHQKTPAFFSSCPSPCAKQNKQTNKLTHRKKSKSTQPTKPTNKNPQALSLVQFLTTQCFFLSRKKNKTRRSRIIQKCTTFYIPLLLTYKMFLLLNRDHHGLLFCFFSLLQKSIASSKPDNLPATYFITDNKLVQSDCNQSADHPVLLPIPERSSSPPRSPPSVSERTLIARIHPFPFFNFINCMNSFVS